MVGWIIPQMAGKEAEKKFMEILYLNGIDFKDETLNQHWYDIKIIADKIYYIEIKNIDTRANSSNKSLINRVNHGKLGYVRSKGNVPFYLFCIDGEFKLISWQVVDRLMRSFKSLPFNRIIDTKTYMNIHKTIKFFRLKQNNIK